MESLDTLVDDMLVPAESRVVEELAWGFRAPCASPSDADLAA
jgi:hypothetical protein